MQTYIDAEAATDSYVNLSIFSLLMKKVAKGQTRCIFGKQNA